MTKIICLFNEAGGVAKTTLVANLSYHLQRRGKRVLVIDLDSSGSLGHYFGINPATLQETVVQTLLDEETPLPIISGLWQFEDDPDWVVGIDLVPANNQLANKEPSLHNLDMREFRLHYALEDLEHDYDYILLDCPGSTGIYSLNALVAASHVLVPIQCEPKSLTGTSGLLDVVRRVQQRMNRDLQFAGFVPTRYSRTVTASTQVLESIQNQLPQLGPVYPPVPSAAAVLRGFGYHLPVALCPGNRDSIEMVTAVFENIVNKLETL